MTNIYRICRKCPIEHYENCETCYGFGVRYVEGKEFATIPISAEETIEAKGELKEFSDCPECGSNYLGLPSQRFLNART